jgi:hypothetical protein
MPVDGERLALTIIGSRGPVGVGVRVVPVTTGDLGEGVLCVPAIALDGGCDHADDLVVVHRDEVADIEAYGSRYSQAEVLSGAWRD